MVDLPQLAYAPARAPRFAAHYSDFARGGGNRQATLVDSLVEGGRARQERRGEGGAERCATISNDDMAELAR
jgi:hypothetical protein